MNTILGMLELAAELKKQAQQRDASGSTFSPPPRGPVPKPVNAAPPAPAAPKTASRAERLQQAPVPGGLQGLFEDGNTLLRAIVASEVLAPPRALRENVLWSLEPNEP
ncbi:MAG: hypothetical protein ABR508_08440 [Candidatus Baltobacteraceae bacterium]